MKYKIVKNNIKRNTKMIYFTSDFHISHTNIIKFCSRPYTDVQDMNKQLIDNWNNTVKSEDDIYNLGDFTFGNNVDYYLSLLNGNIINIRGNHDRNKFCKSWIQRMDFEYGGYKFLLNHRPVFTQGTNDPYKDSERHADINLDEYDYILCGHIHEKWKVNQKNINVGVDVWDYKPVSIDTIIELIKTLGNRTV